MQLSKRTSTKTIGVFAVVSSVLLASGTASQAASCEPGDKALAGLYELTGVMETGSIIVLLADGRFGYELTVGAYDEIARGCWKRDGSTVTLNVNEMRVNDGDQKFKQLKLKLKSGDKLIRDHKGKPWGTYERVAKY